jgi:hypothetical protein
VLRRAARPPTGATASAPVASVVVDATVVQASRSHVEGVPVAESQQTKETVVEKVVTLGLTLAAGWLAQKLVGIVFQKATHADRPLKKDDDSLGVLQATTFAAVSAGVAALTQRFAKKGATRAVARFVSK